MSCLNRLLVLTMVLSLVGIAHAQPPALQVRSGSDALQLLLKPEDLQAGMPGSFTFLLVNRSDHDIRLPKPSAPCRNSVHGFINLVLRFTPAPGGKGAERAIICSVDAVRMGGGILRESDFWVVLHPGDSLPISVKRWAYTTEESAGTYEFQAFYFPPMISAQEQGVLQKAGIDFPRRVLKSSSMMFERK